ncbi:hypothetical protein [Nocardioides sp.]|uniref:hypothetical protein n=1 Tax=Nocardioides sp. TaxID=35761 RepID=UPI0019855C52|nr:hypothetical protein [Nocardioides sp.]MBC7279196.1 hypothetical protein [Nocardioides sp.]
MRTSSSQPRKGKPGGGAGGGRGGKSGGRTGGGKPSTMLGGLSAKMGLADLAKWAADAAEATARRAAEAAGSTARQIEQAAKSARAGAIKDTAARAGVQAQTVRRWARGAQKPSAETEQAGRSKVQRHMGGARAIRASRMAGVKSMSPGSVTVVIKTGPMAGQYETRDLGTVSIARSTAEEVAALIEAGDDDAAAELLSDALLDKYGEDVGGLSGIMSITEFHGSPEWFF